MNIEQKQSFAELQLKIELLDNLPTLGYTHMTPIQAMSLPFILEGRDIIAQAKTGSGKTAAFGLGILDKIDPKKFNTQSLILCPTRELAEQVAAELRRLARKIPNIKVLTICGGSSEYYQQKSLEHSSPIIVGTPGRVLRLLKNEYIHLDQVKQFVLDEADRMLDMGFIDDLQAIMSFLPKKRQNLLFSATFSEEVIILAESILHEPKRIQIDELHEEHVIKQHFIKVDGHREKDMALLTVLKHFKPESAVIFCKTKEICAQTEEFLNENHFPALAIHGDMEQRQRTLVLTKFANRSASILTATDVAARGLDIKELQLVINYDLPQDAKVYIHRIGRTGRAGKEGLALSLYVPMEHERLVEIENELKSPCQFLDLETLAQKENFGPTTQPEMSTLLIFGGKKDKLRPGDILGALVKDGGLEGTDVGSIKILPTVSYVAIKRDKLDDCFKKLKNLRIKGIKLKIEKA